MVFFQQWTKIAGPKGLAPTRTCQKKAAWRIQGLIYWPFLTVWLFFTLTKWDDPSVAPPKTIYLSKPVFFFPSHLLKIIHRVRGHTLHLCGNRTIHKKRETIPDPTKILQKMERVGNMKKIDGFGKLTSLYQEKWNVKSQSCHYRKLNLL